MFPWGKWSGGFWDGGAGGASGASAGRLPGAGGAPWVLQFLWLRELTALCSFPRRSMTNLGAGGQGKGMHKERIRTCTHKDQYKSNVGFNKVICQIIPQIHQFVNSPSARQTGPCTQTDKVQSECTGAHEVPNPGFRQRFPLEGEEGTENQWWG